MKPITTIAIVGRPNVGKSTLFNAMIGKRKSIVSDIAGTTRDSVMEKKQGDAYDYWLIDTAGLTDSKGDSLEEEIQTQARLATQNADMILFLVNGKEAPTLDDQEIIDMMRKSKKPVIFAANKIDDGQESRIFDWAEFGFGLPMALSAKNFTNIWELEEKIEAIIPTLGFEKRPPAVDMDDEDTPAAPLRISFLGRPNVGKSSLLNAFLGHARAVVSERAGTTRDTIDHEFTDEEGQEYVFLDTAGMRRPGKIERDIEFWSTVRTKMAIESSDVCCLIIDALDGVTHQDMKLLGDAITLGKGIIIGVNKFDLVYEKSRMEEETDEREFDDIKMWGEDLNDIKKRFLAYMSRKISFAPWAPVLFFSAKTQKGIPEILQSAKAINAERNKRIHTADLNRFLPEMIFGHTMPSVGNKIGKIKYVSQVATCPPKFLFHVNNQKAFHFSYRRYIENKLRAKFGFFGTPILVSIKDSMDTFKGNPEKNRP